MDGNSRTVASRQADVHRLLAHTVQRHLGQPWRAPSSPHVDAAADAIAGALAVTGRTLLLDSGCGNGSSTEALARLHPGHFAVGVDRSAARLGLRLGDASSGALFLRTDVPRLWQALRARGVRVARHYLLYPNPSPKPAQRLRRWHFHPAFADLLALGGELELRTNWRVYADEFAAALALAGREPVFDAVPEATALTPFERKYRASAHALWRVRAAP